MSTLWLGRQRGVKAEWTPWPGSWAFYGGSWAFYAWREPAIAWWHWTVYLRTPRGVFVLGTYDLGLDEPEDRAAP